MYQLYLRGLSQFHAFSDYLQHYMARQDTQQENT